MKQSHDDHSVVERVDNLLHDAIERGASDIHLEPTKNGLRVRYRIDGVLFDQSFLDQSIMDQIISRLKVLAHINIAEKRIPQDGKFSVQVNNQPIDLRVSTFPGLHGQKMVVRILDRANHTMALGSLGFSADMLNTINRLVQKPNGFFLVTGPTGSGKTTTLYAALSVLNAPDKNIMTLEDPVEYSLDGITQGQINEQAGFTFERGIRSVLRQDPDVLMVGEIRDKQTARIAIEAALTGHVVLSTLHTNDAPSAVMRLMDMGIEPFLINASLSGVLAQRLARKICTECCEQIKPTEQERATLKKLKAENISLSRGVGCKVCGNLGYKGRVGIFELLPVTSDLRALIVKQPVFDDMQAQAKKDGMQTLLVDGLQKVNDGVVTLEELLRVVG